MTTIFAHSPAVILDSSTAERPASSGLLWRAGIFAGLAVMALSIDLPIHRFCDAGRVPGDLRRLFTWSELFAHGIGVGVLSLTIYVLDPARRRRIVRVLATALGSGLLADLVKLGIARSRPHHFSGDSIRETFAGWLPGLWPVEGFSRFDHRLQSFPSGHTAVAVGLAISLSLLYPRGRYLFAGFALLAAFQRIESGAHFLSDTLGGAAIGCLTAAAVSSRSRLASWFDRWERTARDTTSVTTNGNRLVAGPASGAVY